jgi:cytochrome c peroxidase
MKVRAPTILIVAAVAALLAACGTPDTRQAMTQRPSALPPMPHPADNPYTPAKAALGKQLFVDARLSGSGKMACQSCHYRQLGWTDAQALSRKDDGNLNTRHTPSLYNVGYQTAWYWDGRATTLEGQVTAAWRAQIGADPAKVAALLNTVPGYRSQFQAVFGSDATPQNVAQALSTYFRTKVSDDSPWDRYEKGDARAVSKAAIEGQALFAGKGGCIACHTPPFYGNSTFFNVGLEHGKAKPDPGRFNVSKEPADTGAFKTPSLRSVALGAPYFHDGSVATLKEAVRYMAGGGNPDPNRTPLMRPTGLTDAEIDKVVAFLESLTSTETWQAPALP